MVLGYSAPGRDTTHRGKQFRVGGLHVEETYCGIQIDATTWTQHEVDEPSCTRCAGAYARHRAALAPFAPGEPHRYTQTRHPGLAHFLRHYDRGRTVLGYGWRVLGTRTTWTLTRDARAPRGRPWQLALGPTGTDRVAYFTTPTEAVDWTLLLVDADGLVSLYRLLEAGAWDATIPNPTPPLVVGAETKETNPA